METAQRHIQRTPNTYKVTEPENRQKEIREKISQKSGQKSTKAENQYQEEACIGYQTRCFPDKKIQHPIQIYHPETGQEGMR